MHPNRILLADDHPLFRKGLKSLIESINSDSIIVEAADGDEAIRQSLVHDFDLFILDFKMPGMDGYDVSKHLLETDETKKIIIITMYNNAPLITNLFRLGVKGFIMKNSEIDEIETAINTVLRGELYFNKTFEDIIQEALSTKKSLILKFTKRETEIVALLAKGKTSLEISIELNISQRTVDTFRYRLINKVGVKNTNELINYFHQNGLL